MLKYIPKNKTELVQQVLDASEPITIVPALQDMSVAEVAARLSRPYEETLRLILESGTSIKRGGGTTTQVISGQDIPTIIQASRSERIGRRDAFMRDMSELGIAYD